MPSPFPFDTLVRVQIDWSQAGAPVDPATVTLTVEQPDLTVTAYTAGQLTNDTVGEFYRDIDVPLKGTWEYRWEAATPKGVVEGSFNVLASRIDSLNP